MASNINKKASKSIEREKYRGRYKIFKQLRLYLLMALVLSVVATVFVGINSAKEQKELQNIVVDGQYRDIAAAYIDDAYLEKHGIAKEDGQVSVMALSFYFYKDFYAMVNDKGFYTGGYGTMGLDPSKPLREQEYTVSRSWFDELMNSASANAVSTLQYSAIAEINDIKLDADDQKKIDKEIEGLKAEAKKEKMGFSSYLSYRYCPGMTEADLQYALERYYLAEKFYNESRDEAFVCTDSEVEDYYNLHKDELLSAYVYRYEIKFDDSTKAEAEKRAEDFMACEDKDSFFALVKESAAKDHGFEGEDLDSFLKECRITVGVGDYTGEFGDWLFAEERANDDKFKLSADGYIGVYYLVRAPGKYTFPSVSSRSIFISAQRHGSSEKAKEKAKEVYDLALKDGKEDSFVKLVEKYSDDSTTVSYGGLYTGVVPGDLAYEYEQWAFAEGRKVGDIGLIEIQGDYFVVYFTGTGDPCWHVSAERALIEEKMAALDEQIASAAEVNTNKSAMFETVPDYLATDNDRGYTLKDENGKAAVDKDFSLWLVLLIALDVIICGLMVFAFIYTKKLKREYGYNF